MLRPWRTSFKECILLPRREKIDRFEDYLFCGQCARRRRWLGQRGSSKTSRAGGSGCEWLAVWWWLEAWMRGTGRCFGWAPGELGAHGVGWGRGVWLARTRLWFWSSWWWQARIITPNHG